MRIWNLSLYLLGYLGERLDPSPSLFIKNIVRFGVASLPPTKSFPPWPLRLTIMIPIQDYN
jgi:hypothetical protein